MKRALYLGLAVFAIYALTAGGHLYSPDEEVYFRVTRSLARGEGLAVEPLPDHGMTSPTRPPRADGREFAQYGIGQPLLAVPFYWAGALLAHAGGDSLWQRLYGHPAYGPEAYQYPATAAELAPRWVCSWFNIFVGAALAVLVCLLALELTHSPSAATWAALLYAFGTLAWPHSRPFFSESLAALCIALAWYSILRALRGRLVPWCCAAGVAAGYAAMVRLDSILAYPALALLLLGPIVKARQAARRGPIQPWLAFCIPAALLGAIILALNDSHFGSIFKTGYENQEEGFKLSTPLLSGLYGLLFSVGRGMFFFSPPLILSLWGWRPLWQLTRARHAAFVPAVALAIAVPLFFQAKWQNWPGGWCWGPRHIFMIHCFLVLPIAAWLAVAIGPLRRIVAPALLALGVGVQLIGCSQDFIAFYRQFFRISPSGTMFWIQYDPDDQRYWEPFFQVRVRRTPAEPWREAPLAAPVPIQYSLYHPQLSIWTGYSRMFREGELDNFWIGLLRGEPESIPPRGALPVARPASRPGVAPSPPSRATPAASPAPRRSQSP